MCSTNLALCAVSLSIAVDFFVPAVPCIYKAKKSCGNLKLVAHIQMFGCLLSLSFKYVISLLILKNGRLY